MFEAFLYIWIAAFAYDEISGMNDAGIVFYQMDFWSLWDMAIIGTGIAFVVASKLQMQPRVFHGMLLLYLLACPSLAYVLTEEHQEP